MATALLTRSMARKLISAKPSNRGIMVSPGRYINLSGAPLTIEQQMRLSIDGAIRAAGFTQHCLRCEELLLEALKDAWHYRLNPHESYLGKKVTRKSFGTKRPNDRNQELIRMYLLSRLWYCWMLGTGNKPVTNNRRNSDSPFVIFVKTLGAWFGLGNIVKNAERYQAYRKRNFMQLITGTTS
jgi:hypothetical protein